MSTDHDHAPSKRLRNKHIKEMHHAAAKVLGSSANVTITPVHPLAKLCMLIAILLTHNALLDSKPAVPDVGTFDPLVIMKPCVELGDCVCGNSAPFLYQLLGGIT